MLLGTTVIILGSAGWLYYRFFMSTDAALRHAEAFNWGLAISSFKVSLLRTTLLSLPANTSRCCAGTA